MASRVCKCLKASGLNAQWPCGDKYGRISVKLDEGSLNELKRCQNQLTIWQVERRIPDNVNESSPEELRHAPIA